MTLSARLTGRVSLADLRRLWLQRRVRAGRASSTRSPATGAPAVPSSGAALDFSYGSIRQWSGRACPTGCVSAVA